MIVGNNNMSCFTLLSIRLIYLFTLSKIIPYTTVQAQQYRFHICLGANYTTNSTYQTNLNLLLPLLSSADASKIENGYYNDTVGRNSSDTVYGSLQCRGDASLEACQICAQRGTEQINKMAGCPNSKQAIIWYDTCMLRYSNIDYFNIMQEMPAFYLSNLKDISNPDQFRPILDAFMHRLVKEALTIAGSPKFVAGETKFTNTTKVYGYVQCTEDISASDCYRCLLGAISELPDCCDAKQGGQILTPSCILRFELYPLFQSMNTPSPPPSSTNTTTPNTNGNNSSVLLVRIIVPSVIAILSVSAISFWFFCFQRKKGQSEHLVDVSSATKSLQFNFSTVSAATDNFSEANKLGEGGFGSVYKGTLPGEQQIAVKRLAKNSGQGDQEFKTEVTLVAKLQHRNLVKLVGFSLAGEEKLLIYEFLPNASLDQFLFDPMKRRQLDWESRYKIIGGIARGLVYLHEESRLKIVHRDLKASNILLDMNMHPKIADFGMARLFVLDQSHANTNRIVGTRGYMAPEYAMHGEFSVKSDVFSFGVLVLEIVIGRRNSSFHKSDIARDLLSYAWRHWNNGSAIDILDATLKDKCSRRELMRCIHVALLCVQENVADRPTMPTVFQMLNNSVTGHSSPSPPAFWADSEEQGSSKNGSVSETATLSLNDVTLTELYPR